MQNIRISIDVLKLKDARLCRFPNAANVPTDYVCIPVAQCFVPKDAPKPYLMATMIHCPNAQYGDFMLKPYVSSDDYKALTREEQHGLPIIGKGTFMKEATNKALAAASTVVTVQDINPTPTVTPQADIGSAAISNVAPSPAGGGPVSEPNVFNDFWVYTVSGWQSGFGSFEDAAQYAQVNVDERFIIAQMIGAREVARWAWDRAGIAWVSVEVPKM